MVAFRLSRPNKVFTSTPALMLVNPLFFFIFLYFLFSSADTLNVSVVVFKAKLTNLLALFLSVLVLIASRIVQIPRKFSVLVIALLGCMCISASNSQNLVVCTGFILFFIFNYVCYFLVTYSLFFLSRPNVVLRVYFYSFYCVGFYALCQILFSAGGITLPGVGQFIRGVARGQGFSYEPSFYALYMTPFAMYYTAKYLLEAPSVRRVKEVFWPNFLLLVSTSTGCFFSYLFFVFFMILFKAFGFLKFSVWKLLVRFSVSCAVIIFALFSINKNLIVAGFLKFFYVGGAHFSVQERWRGITEYWKIFLENPLVGVGFGSGPYYVGAKKLGYIDLLDPVILQEFSPTNVTTEVLAGVGILGGIGFLVFFYFLVQIFRETLRLSNLTEEDRIMFVALSISLCVMFSTLQFNQSIMRSYMWIHVGVFCGFARCLKQKYSDIRRIKSDEKSMV